MQCCRLSGDCRKPFACRLLGHVTMTQSAKALAVLALHRFGLGPRAGSIRAIEADPRGALLAELETPRAGEIAAPDLPGSALAFRTVANANAERQAKRMVAQRAQKEAMASEASQQADNDMAARVAAEAVPDPGRQ